MTNINPPRSGRSIRALNDLVVNLFTGAILVLAGFLTFAQFANV